MRLPRSLGTILTCAAMVFLGNALLITVLPIRAQYEGFAEGLIGLMGTVHFAGFALGCLIGPKMVKQVGHIRCFAGFGALMGITVLIFPSIVEPITWCVLRALGGVCIAILYLVIESWLNDSAGNEIRGAVLSIYVILTSILTVGGQMAVNLFDVAAYEQFTLAAIFIALALVPLTLIDTATPKPIPEARLRIGRLWSLSPSGFVACIAVGFVEGSFWSLGPVFAQSKGMIIGDITIFMAAFVVGGAIGQWPIGRVSDFVDRRWIIVACCLGTMSTALTLTVMPFDSQATAIAVAVLHGSFMVPLYPLGLAHVNDYAPNEELVEVSSGLLLLYGTGAILGPATVGLTMEHFDAGALFVVMVGVLGGLAAFVLIRSLMRSYVADKLMRLAFAPVPKTTQSVYSLETDD